MNEDWFVRFRRRQDQEWEHKFSWFDSELDAQRAAQRELELNWMKYMEAHVCGWDKNTRLGSVIVVQRRDIPVGDAHPSPSD